MPQTDFWRSGSGSPSKIAAQQRREPSPLKWKRLQAGVRHDPIPDRLVRRSRGGDGVKCSMPLGRPPLENQDSPRRSPHSLSNRTVKRALTEKKEGPLQQPMMPDPVVRPGGLRLVEEPEVLVERRDVLAHRAMKHALVKNIDRCSDPLLVGSMLRCPEAETAERSHHAALLL